MPSHIETLLTEVGVPAEDIAAVTALKDTDQFDPKPIVGKVKSSYQTQFQNDPNFFSDLTVEKLPAEVRKKLENTSFGRASGLATQKVLKAFGMTEADYADLPEETKEKFENLIPAIAEKFTKTKSGAKEIQEQLIAERRKREELEAKFGADYEKTIEEKHTGIANQKISAAIFNASLVGELSSIPGLKIPASDIAATASQIIQSKYGFERIGDYTVELRQKANPQMKVLKNGSSQELTLKDALVEIATERGWIEAKDGDDKRGGGTVTITPDKGTLKMVPPHVQKAIEKKIAASKQG